MLNVICHKEMQIKTTMRYHYPSVRMTKIQTTPNAGEDVEQQELSFTAGVNAKWCSTLEDSLTVSYKAKYILTISSSNCAP